MKKNYDYSKETQCNEINNNTVTYLFFTIFHDNRIGPEHTLQSSVLMKTIFRTGLLMCLLCPWCSSFDGEFSFLTSIPDSHRMYFSLNAQWWVDGVFFILLGYLRLLSVCGRKHPVFRNRPLTVLTASAQRHSHYRQMIFFREKSCLLRAPIS